MDVPNWPQLTTAENLESGAEGENDPTSRSDNLLVVNSIEPEPANMTWFHSKDTHQTRALSLQELTDDACPTRSQHWFDIRFCIAMGMLLNEADLNNDSVMDITEYLK